MTILEKLVSFRIEQKSVLFQCENVEEKKELISTLCGLGFNKELMFDCLNEMNTALFVGLMQGETIFIYVCPPTTFFFENFVWDLFKFEYS